LIVSTTITTTLLSLVDDDILSQALAAIIGSGFCWAPEPGAPGGLGVGGSFGNVMEGVSFGNMMEGVIIGNQNTEGAIPLEVGMKTMATISNEWSKRTISDRNIYGDHLQQRTHGTGLGPSGERTDPYLISSFMVGEIL
jgi:hypothetical protein